jgi:hypothetical protein
LAVGWLGLRFLIRPKAAQFAAKSLLQIGLFLILSAALLPLIFAWAARGTIFRAGADLHNAVIGPRILGSRWFTSGASF